MANEEEPGSVTKPPKPTTTTASKGGGEDAWWKRVKTPRISLHDFPVWGVKVSKTVNLKGHEAIDGKTSVTVGAMADYTSKTAHTFAKLEHEVGEPGKLAIDVTGVELQKKFELFEGAMGATDVTLGVGVGWDGNPYINFDAMPSSAVFKAAGLATAIHSGRSIDLRPSKAVTPNIAIESPFSIYRDGMEVNLQFHGAIAAVSLPKSDLSIAKA